MRADITATYWQDITPISKPLTRAQEQEEFRRLHAGDTSARDRLVHANLRFVVRMARSYDNRGVAIEDLIGHGNHGLMTALDRFDPERGFKFITYAVWWIRQAIVKAVMEADTVRKSFSALQDRQDLEKVGDRLTQEFQRVPTPDEVRESLGLSTLRTDNATLAGHRTASLDARLPSHSEDDGSTLAELLGEEDPDPHFDYTLVRNCVDNLPPRDAMIVRKYYLDSPSMNLQQIGDELGLTRERIRQLRDLALERLQGKAVLQELVA